MKAKCEKCGKDAIFFDVNLQAWLCEDCVKEEYKTFDLDGFMEGNSENIYNSEFNNILTAMEKLCNSISESNNKRIERQFKNTPYSKDLNELLSNSDIRTVNIPLNKENKNLISKDKIRLMK